MSREVYQIEISLKGIEPKIWRLILVYSDTSLVNFHRIIQTTMGWTNSHLHLFSDGIYVYSPKEFEVEDALNSRRVKLDKILHRGNTRIQYEYDFGDGWDHDIILEKIRPADDLIKVPICIQGNRNCPPEDCGGTWGYDEMLDVLKQPDHKDYDSYIEWLGGEFDPEYFNRDEINVLLSKRNYGCIWL